VAGYERFQASLNRIYEDFTGKVAEGRADLSLEEVLEVAKGRIWSGEDAKELGLIDELGGYDVALRLIREEIDLEEDAPIRLKLFPRKRTPLDKLFGERAESSESAVLVSLARTLETIQPAARILDRMGMTSEPQVLEMPDLEGAP
jgi:protease-4